MQDSAIATVNKSYLDAGMATNLYPNIGRPIAGWKEAKVGESVQKLMRHLN